MIPNVFSYVAIIHLISIHHIQKLLKLPLLLEKDDEIFMISFQHWLTFFSK